MEMALSDNRDQIVRRVLRDLKDRFGGKIVGRKLLPIAAEASALIEPAAEPISDTAQWYVLLCHPMEERGAAAHLTGRRFKVYLPTIPRITTRGVRRCKSIIQWPMFPGYLFIRLDFRRDGARLHHVNATPGINRFLRLDDDYAIIPEHEIERVQEVEQDQLKAHQRRENPVKWELGEKVRIAEGPFCGLNADVVRLDDAERITVLLSLLRRAVKVTFPTNVLEKL